MSYDTPFGKRHVPPWMPRWLVVAIDLFFLLLLATIAAIGIFGAGLIKGYEMAEKRFDKTPATMPEAAP